MWRSSGSIVWLIAVATLGASFLPKACSSVKIRRAFPPIDTDTTLFCGQAPPLQSGPVLSCLLYTSPSPRDRSLS
eukprot:7096452-Pyramimonas_sp.AAC.1